jgi:hypothetical protein
MRMRALGFESPLQTVLAQADALGVTPDVRKKLELADIDFCSEAVRLFSQRQLLEFSLKRAKSELGSGLTFTAESLAAVDAIIAQLRQTWLRASEEARSMLSADQLVRLPVGADILPSFESDATEPVAVGLDTMVAGAVAARIKDAKVVEVETAQAIAERLLSWAKSAALVTAVPLALVAIVLTVLGISNWTDFSSRIAQAGKVVDAQLAAAQQSAHEIGAKAITLQAQYAELQKRFGDVTALAGDVSALSSKTDALAAKVERLETSGLPAELRASVEQEIKAYREYLESLGYHPPATELKVVLQTSEPGNAYYDGKQLFLAPKLVSMPDILDHEYTFHALKEMNPAFWQAQAANWRIAAIAQGLSEYLPCSYLGNPKYGVKAIQELGSLLSPELRARGYLRDFANSRPFATDASPVVAPPDTPSTEPHNAGETWGGVFWDIRRIVGCKDVTEKCPTADHVLLDSWVNLTIEPGATADVRIAQDIIQRIQRSGSADQAAQVRESFKRRGLSLPS